MSSRIALYLEDLVRCWDQSSLQVRLAERVSVATLAEGLTLPTNLEAKYADSISQNLDRFT